MSAKFIGLLWLTSYLRTLSYSQTPRLTHSLPEQLCISLHIHRIDMGPTCLRMYSFKPYPSAA